MAKEKKAIMEDVQVAAFKLLKEEYGVNILNVQEIKVLTDITRVPFAPDYIKGVINLRGSVLPVIDLKRVLHRHDRRRRDGSADHLRTRHQSGEGRQRQHEQPLCQQHWQH